MKLVKISVFVDVDDAVVPEEVLRWVDHALGDQKLPLEFETYQTGIGEVIKQPVETTDGH